MSQAARERELEMDLSAKLAVIELAVVALGKLALAGPRSRMTVNDQVESRQALFDALEVLNNEKENY